MKNDKSFAFTLAETLLTLTIAGVLMALMLRAINRVNPDKEKILFLKTYHALETVMANTINDSTKYSPNYYSDSEIDKMTTEEKNSLHLDFRYTPLPSAKVTFIKDGKQKTACPKVTKGDGTVDTQGCDVELTKDNAMCYFIADQLNSVGDVNCEEEGSVINMKTSQGACLRNFVGVYDGASDSQPNGSNDPVIDPLCNNQGYVIWIFHDGKMTVPEEHYGIGERQKKAYEWMNDQTTVKSN